MEHIIDWRPFAERLTHLSKKEGQPDFLDSAFSFLNEYVKIDSCAVFKIAGDKMSGADHLCTFGLLKPELAELLANDYVANGFKNDPMVQTALLSPNVRVRQLPESQYSSSYRSQYFEKANLIDKVTSIHASNNILFLVSFYRKKSSGQFSREDFKDLERLAPIIGRFVLRHVRLSLNKNNLTETYAQKIGYFVKDSTQVMGGLSQRERELCEHILIGKTEKEIAEHLNITLNTVITYRRRAYAKLNISSKLELFKLALISQM